MCNFPLLEIPLDPLILLHVLMWKDWLRFSHHYTCKCKRKDALILLPHVAYIINNTFISEPRGKISHLEKKLRLSPKRNAAARAVRNTRFLKNCHRCQIVPYFCSGSSFEFPLSCDFCFYNLRVLERSMEPSS